MTTILNRFPGWSSDRRVQRTNRRETDRHALACVVACAGISTHELEEGIILELLAACVAGGDARAQEILERFTTAGPKPSHRPVKSVPSKPKRRSASSRPR